jgi:hypothetical protein
MDRRQVINFYFKKNLAEMDQKQCQAEPEQNRSGFLGSFFWQQLTDEKHNDMTVQGKTIIEMFLDCQSTCLGGIFSI